MSEEKKSTEKNCGSKKSAMLAYGVIQLGSSVISALSLAAIALSLCSMKQETKLFNNCVEEARENGRSNSSAVHFCNGGR